MGRSSRNGIVVKTGDSIEKLATAKTIAFNKTGTLTQGNLTVDQVKLTDGVNADQLLQLAASVEQNSGHVIAQSITNYALDHQVTLLPTSEVKEVTGNGSQAMVNGQLVKVGKLAFATDDQTSRRIIKQLRIFPLMVNMSAVLPLKINYDRKPFGPLVSCMN